MDASEIDDMTHHYAIAALWSSTDTRCQINAESTCDHDGRKGADACDTCRYGGEPLDREFGVEDIAPETMAEFRSDCEAFYESCADDLADMEAGQAGHDFWLTRNGHGAGFWDRGLGDRGERLSEMARPFGSVDLFVTAEGTVSGQ